MHYSTLVLSAILSIALLGCSPQPEKAETSPVTEVIPNDQSSSIASNSTYNKSVPANAPTYKVAMTGRQAPFTFMDEYGNFQGIDVDIMRALAEVEGFNVEFHKENYSEIVQSIENGENDMIFGGVSYSDSRAENYTLSDSYLYVPSAIMYDSTKHDIKDASELGDLKFAGVPVVKQTQDILDMYPDIDHTITGTTYLAFEKLLRGEVDFLAEDLQVLEYLMLQYPDHDLSITTYQSEDDPDSQQIAMLKKGKTNLVGKLNHGFEVLTSNGEIKRIEEKWLAESNK